VQESHSANFAEDMAARIHVADTQKDWAAWWQKNVIGGRDPMLIVYLKYQLRDDEYQSVAQPEVTPANAEVRDDDEDLEMT
ncbi:hypothetical protein LTR66_016093, partial [Elasticomyces elasticus]